MLFISTSLALLASAVAAAPFNNLRNSCAAPSLPLNGGASELPSPSGSLAYIALGRGTQNYTCSAAGATPVAIGAVARLYDASPWAKYSVAGEFNEITQLAVYSDGDFPGLNVLGKHFFDAAGTPVFDLFTVSKILFAAKTGDVPAPTGAESGPSGTGAVDWLSLAAKTGYTSVGLKQVYRVETAGGSPIKPCTAAGVESVQYAAQYWFYN